LAPCPVFVDCRRSRLRDLLLLEKIAADLAIVVLLQEEIVERGLGGLCSNFCLIIVEAIFLVVADTESRCRLKKSCSQKNVQDGKLAHRYGKLAHDSYVTSAVTATLMTYAELEYEKYEH
jgi:hypothetical protein